MTSGSAASRILCALTLIFILGCKPSSDQAAVAGNNSSDTPHTHEDEKPYEPFKPFQAPREFIRGVELSAAERDSPEYIRDWIRFNTANEYFRCGRTNALWDDPALAGFELYAELRSLKESEGRAALVRSRAGAKFSEAIAAGCDDPLVRYLHARTATAQRADAASVDFERVHTAVADDMGKTDYAPLRKAWANLRAAEMMKANLPEGASTPERLTNFRRAAIHYLNEALNDRSIPPREAAEITKFVWAMAEISAVGRYDMKGLIFPTFEKLWSKHAFAYWVRGDFYINQAWRERGSGYSDKVTDKGWQGFQRNLELAEKTLRNGWNTDASDIQIPISMITVCMGAGYPRAEMERWFARALKLDSASYEAVNAKEYYLEPKWHGSDREVLAFGRECVASANYRGRIPLILPAIHEKLRKYYEIDPQKYYSRPEVWRDIRAAYERFFELNPEEIGYRHNYASAAYASRQYETFLEQLPLFTTGTNYNYFGGRDKFESMVKTAQAAQKN